MPESPQHETLSALRLRHSQLLQALPASDTAEISRLRVLNCLVAIQLDLARFHAHTDLAGLLIHQLDTLLNEPLTEPKLSARALALLHPSS